MTHDMDQAVTRLRDALPKLEQYVDLREIEASRQEVYERFQPIFRSEALPSLTAEAFRSFLPYSNNHHWSGIARQGPAITQDMNALRQALAVLLDDAPPLAGRYDEATQLVKGLGRATATPILHVVYPDRYGVWNKKSEAGLRELGLYPDDAGRTDGEQFAAVNALLLELSGKAGVDLWTLDSLWEALYKEAKLAPPFDATFTDREQAEWAFDFFRETVERLGGRPDDTDSRFALTLPQGRPKMRLNMGNWAVFDVRDGGQNVRLSLLAEPTAAQFDYANVHRFAEDNRVAQFLIPAQDVQQWPPALASIYEDSMHHIAERFGNRSASVYRKHHQPELFQALFDEQARDKLLSEGLTPSPPPTVAKQFQGFTADAFAFLRELEQNNNKAWMEANENRWVGSVREPVRHLFADLGLHVKAAFDPYLSPDALEITPDARHTLARISKNWTATPDNQYYLGYWGAFYREGRQRTHDAQLHFNVIRDAVHFGFHMGENDAEIRQRFAERIRSNPAQFLSLLNYLELVSPSGSYATISAIDGGTSPERALDTLAPWLQNGDFAIMRRVVADQAVAHGPALADEVLAAFKRVFPIFLWAVAEDYEAAIERYLDDVFPPDPDDGIDELTPARYTESDFLTNTHLLPETLTDLRAMIDDRQQLMFYGPPGTGKTYVARELGKLLTGLAEPPPERLEMIQFHPAYSYEDFIEGIRPESKEHNGQHIVDYPIWRGVFRRFCERAATLNGPCVFIIDEINRGNIARIFGELMLLLEYRDASVPLPYSGKRFTIPENVILIGTMNTADRSIALVDFALRRRFHFFQFAADPDLFDRWLEQNGGASLSYLGKLYRHLATEAIDDPNYAIGPSYFMKNDLQEEHLRRIWQRSIVPYIQEYYFDQPAKANQWEWNSDFMHSIRQGNNGA